MITNRNWFTTFSWRLSIWITGRWMHATYHRMQFGWKMLLCLTSFLLILKIEMRTTRYLVVFSCAMHWNWAGVLQLNLGKWPRRSLQSMWRLNFENSFNFSKFRPKLEHISDISFHRPVHVSSIIKMAAHVIYTEVNYIEIVLVTETYESNDSSPNTTNVFYYTFSTPERVPQIIPKTYHEAMWYLDGRRKFNAAMGLDGQQPDSQYWSITPPKPWDFQ